MILCVESTNKWIWFLFDNSPFRGFKLTNFRQLVVYIFSKQRTTLILLSWTPEKLSSNTQFKICQGVKRLSLYHHISNFLPLNKKIKFNCIQKCFQPLWHQSKNINSCICYKVITKPLAKEPINFTLMSLISTGMTGH